MKVAVFGSGGYIGRRLAARLRTDGAEVIAYSSGHGGIFDPLTGVLQPKVEVPAGTACVIYLSQSPRFRQMPGEAGHLWGVNVVSAIRVATLARQSGVRRFIYASTGNVYEPSFDLLREDSALRRDDWYALSKVHAEESLDLFKEDMSVLCARIFGVYGPDQTDRLVPNLVNAIRAGLPIKLASNPNSQNDNGGLRMSLCYIDDVVGIFSRLVSLDTAGRINIAGPQVLSIRDVAQAIGQHVRQSPSFEAASQPRTFDLMADIAKLVQVCQPRFTAFEEGLSAVLSPNGT